MMDGFCVRISYYSSIFCIRFSQHIIAHISLIVFARLDFRWLLFENHLEFLGVILNRSNRFSIQNTLTLILAKFFHQDQFRLILKRVLWRSQSLTWIITLAYCSKCGISSLYSIRWLIHNKLFPLQFFYSFIFIWVNYTFNIF